MNSAARDEQYGLKTGDYVRSRGNALGRVVGWQGRDLVQVLILEQGRSALTVGMITLFTPDSLSLVERVDS